MRLQNVRVAVDWTPMAAPSKPKPATAADLRAITDNDRLEIIGGSIVEKAMARTLAVPASRFFRMHRSVSLLVSAGDDGQPNIVEGLYQSPILVQWQHAPRQSRVLDVAITEIR